MANIRTRRRSHFTTIPNDAIRDPNLSLQAKGLLTLMLSYPDDWRFTTAHLERQSTNGREATRTALRQLIAAGYARWHATQAADGSMTGRELIVTDHPAFLDATTTTAERETRTTERRATRGTGNPPHGKHDTTKTESYEDPSNEQLPPRATPETPPAPGGHQEEEEEVVVDLRESEPLDLPAGARRALRDRANAQTDSHLVTHYPALFAQLVTLRRLTGAKCSDELFRTWALETYRLATQHGPGPIAAALDATIGNFASLTYPWSFFRAAATTAATRAATPTSDALPPGTIDDLVQRALDGTL